MQFIDLFSGLGCFHIALKKLGHECVFACEINKELNELYEENHKIKPEFDITKIDISKIPNHQILCAGFPCQPFSKAGMQKGIDDERGNLIDKVIEILAVHRPQYFILENVRNLEKHNDGLTWKVIKLNLEKLGYNVKNKIISPHEVGVPQHRERIFIVGSLNSLDEFKWFKTNSAKKNSSSILKTPKIITPIEKDKQIALDLWESILKVLPKDAYPYSPLWSMEFGATYPIDNIDFKNDDLTNFKNYLGSFGKPIVGNSKDEILSCLPNYIKTQKGEIPQWKKNYIINNRNFYLKYKGILDNFIFELIELNKESCQKFEWNCGRESKTIWNKLIQFRGSGIRIKKTDYFPSLVTVSTQIPIIGQEKRYISEFEAAKLQSIPKNVKLPATKASTFKALGNAVNIKIIKLISYNLLKN